MFISDVSSAWFKVRPLFFFFFFNEWSFGQVIGPVHLECQAIGSILFNRRDFLLMNLCRNSHIMTSILLLMTLSRNAFVLSLQCILYAFICQACSSLTNPRVSCIPILPLLLLQHFCPGNFPLLSLKQQCCVRFSFIFFAFLCSC